MDSDESDFEIENDVEFDLEFNVSKREKAIRRKNRRLRSGTQQRSEKRKTEKIGSGQLSRKKRENLDKVEKDYIAQKGVTRIKKVNPQKVPDKTPQASIARPASPLPTYQKMPKMARIVEKNMERVDKAREDLLKATKTFVNVGPKAKDKMDKAHANFVSAISQLKKLSLSIKEAGGNHAGSAVDNNGIITVKAGLAKLRVTSTEIDPRTRRRSTAKTTIGFGANIRFGRDVITIYLSVENGRTFTFTRRVSDVPFKVYFRMFDQDRARDAQRLSNYATMSLNNTPTPEALQTSVRYFNRMARFASNVTFLKSNDELRSIQYIVQSVRAEMALARNSDDPRILRLLAKRLNSAEKKLRRLQPSRATVTPLITVVNSQPKPNIINANAISNVSEVTYAQNSNVDMERRLRGLEMDKNKAIKSLQQKLESLEKQCAQERAKNSDMQAKIDMCNMESKDQMEALKQRMQSTRREIEDIASNNEMLENERNKLRDEVNRLKMAEEDRRQKKNSGPPGMQPADRIRTLEKELKEIRSTLDSTRQEIAQIADEKDILEREKNMLESDNDRITKEKEKMARQNAELMDNVEDVSDELESKEAELAAKEEELRRKNKELKEKENMIKAVRLRNPNYVEDLPGYELDKTPLAYFDDKTKSIIKNGINYPDEDVLPIPNLESIKRLLEEKDEERRNETFKKVYGVSFPDTIGRQITRLEKLMSRLNDNNLSGDELGNTYNKYDSAVKAFLNSLKKYPKEKSGVPMARRSNVNSMIHIARMMSSRRASIYSDSDDSDEEEDRFEELPSREDVVDMFDTTTIVSTVAGMINSDKPMDLSKLRRSETSGYYGTAQDMDLERMINDSSRWESESVQSFEMTDDDMDGEW